MTTTTRAPSWAARPADLSPEYEPDLTKDYPPVPPEPETMEAALAFAWWLGRLERDRAIENNPSDLAGVLQRTTAMARLAYREVDRESLLNDEDQLHALLDSCGTLTQAVESVVWQLRILWCIQEGERLLRRRQFWQAVHAARNGRPATVEQLEATEPTGES